MTAFLRTLPINNMEKLGTGFWISIVFLAIITGMIAVVLPYWIIVALIISPIFPAIAWSRPEYAVVAILAIGSGIIKQQFLPMIPILGGSVSPADLALLILIPIVLLKSYPLGNTRLNTIRIFIWSMLLLLVLTIVSMIRANFYFDTPIKDTLGETRHFLHWLLAPMLVLMLDNEVKLNRLMKGLWVIGVIFSIGQIIQSVFGIFIFGQGVVGVLKTVDQTYAGLYRSQSSGVTFSILAFYLAVTGYLLKISNVTKIIPFTFLFIMAILVSFGRGIWATTLLGLGIISLSLGFKKGIKLIGAFTLIMVIGIGVVGAIKPASLAALKDRALSASDDVEHGSSLNWRFYEDKMAMIKLNQYPVLGIGLGTAYRPPAVSDVTPEQVRYVHNGYLYMVLKLGPLALLVLIGVVFAFFQMAKKLLRSQLPDKYRAVVIASIALFSQLLVLSITQPEFLMMSWGIGVLAMLIGILGAMSNLLESGGLTISPTPSTKSH